MKYLLITLTLALTFGCEDQLTKTDTEVVTTPSICPEPNPELGASPYKLDGLNSVRVINQTSAEFKWTHVDGFKFYHIISLHRLNRKILKTVNAPTGTVIVKGLEPDTNYDFIVRGMDQAGHLDGNLKVISVRTKPWPNYANLKSLQFNSSQSVNLGASKNFMPTNKLTVSFWFKSQNKSIGNEERLFTFHKGDFAGTGLALSLIDDKLKLSYAKTKNDISSTVATKVYNDNLWHHIAVTYNGNLFRVYYDGISIIQKRDTFYGLGNHPAHIAAYTGFQKGFKGLLDEFAVFTIPLGKNNIQDVYNNGVAADLRRHPRINKLISWYRMGDHGLDNKTHLEDIIGVNHGTPLNIENTDFVQTAP
jgi:hypothetical protein